MTNLVTNFVAPAFVQNVDPKQRKRLEDMIEKGNVFSPLQGIVPKGDSLFEQYCNTVYAMVEYQEKGETSDTVFSAKNVDPSSYNVLPTLQQVIQASRINLSETTPVYKKPVFQYQLPEFAEGFSFMRPATFNSFQKDWGQHGSSNVYDAAHSLDVTRHARLEDVQVVYQGQTGYLLHSSGAIAPQVSFALGISLDGVNVADMLPSVREISVDEVVEWLVQGQQSSTSTNK